MSRLKKIAVIAGGSVLGLIVLTVAGAGVLLGTTTGSALLLNKTAALLEGTVNLRGEIVSGSLLSGFKIDGPFEVEVPGVVKVSSANLELDYDLPGFLSSRILNVNKLKAGALKVELLAGTGTDAAEAQEEPETAAEDSGPFRLNIPLHIVLSSLESTDFAYLSQIVDVEAKKLDLALEANGDYAAVQGGFIEDVLVHLKDSEPEQTAEPETVAAEPSAEELAALAVFGGGAEPLGPVDLPLDADLHNLKVRRGRYYMSVFDTGLVDFEVDAEWRHTKLQVKKLDAVHAWGKFGLKGDMLFEEYFGLDFALEGEGASTEVTRDLFEGALYGLKGTATVTGSLADINLQADITAPQPFSTSLRFNCLSPALTLDLDLAAAQLRYPLLSGAYLNLPEGSLSSLGTSAAAGTAGTEGADGSAVSGYVPRLNVPSEQGNEILLKDLHLKGSGALMTGVNTELGGNLTGFGFKGVETQLKGKLGITENFVEHLEIEGGYSVAEDSRSDFKLLADHLKLTGSEPGTGGTFSFESPDASGFSPQLNGKAALKAQGLSAGYFSDQVVLNLGELDADFVLNSLKARAAAADIAGDLQNGFDIGSLRFTQGNNHADVSGKLGHDSSLAGNFSLPRLDLIHNALGGSLQGNFRVDGDYLQPKVQLAVNSSKEFNAGGLILNNLKVDANIDAVEWTAKVDASSDYVKFSDALQPSGKCIVHASGTRAAHILELNCAGTNGGTLSLRGGMDEQFTVWEGDLNALSFSSEYTSPMSLKEPVHAKVTLSELHGEVSPLEIAGKLGRVSLGKSEFTADSLRSSLNISGLQLGSFAAFLPEGLRIEDTPVNVHAGSIDVKFKPDSVPDINADLELEAGSGSFAMPGLELPWDGLKLTALLDQDAWTVQQLDFSLADGNGTLRQDPQSPLRLHDPLGTGELSGKILLEELNLGLFSSLTGQTMEGRAGLETMLGGTLTAPEASSVLKSSFGGFGLSGVQAELKAKSALEESTLEALTIGGSYGPADKSTAFTLKADGKLVYASDPGFDGSLTLESPDLSGLAPQLKGKLSLHADQIHAALAGATPVLGLGELNTDFILNSLASNLNVRGISGDLGRGFEVEELKFEQGEQNTLNLSGKLLRDHSTFGGKFALKNLAGLDSILAGALAGELKLEGDFMHPSVQLTANSEDLGVAGIVLKNLDVNAGVSLAEAAQGADLRVTTDSVKFSESMQPVGKCSIVASGWLPGHSLDLNCEGENGAVIALKGGLDEALTRWEGELDALSLSSEFSGALTLEEPVHAQVNLNELQGSVGLIKLSGDPGSLSIGTAGSKDGQHPGGSEFSLKDVRSGLDFSLPELASIPVLTDLLKGALEGRLRVSGQLLQPEVTLDVNSPELGAAGTSLSGLKLNAKVVTRKPDAGTAAAPAAAVAAVTTAAHPVTDFVLYPAALVEEKPQAFDLGSQHVELSIVSDSVKFSDALKSAGKCSVNLSGWISSHALEVDCDGDNGGILSLRGGMDEQFTVWEGTLSSLSVCSQYTSPLDLQQQVHARIRLDELHGEVSPLELAGEPGVISLGKSEFTTGSLRSSLNITGLQPRSFAAFLPGDLRIEDTPVNVHAGTIDIKFKPDAVPDIHTDLELEAGSGSFAMPGLELPWDGLKLTALLDQDAWTVQELAFTLADGNGTLKQDPQSPLRLHDPLGTGELSGKILLKELNLGLFSGLAGQPMEGRAGLEIVLGGTLKAPEALSTLKSSFGGFGLSDVQAELKAKSGLEESALEALTIGGTYGSADKSTAFTLKADGKLVYARDPGFEGSLTLESPDLSGLAPQLNGKLSLTAREIRADLAREPLVLGLGELNTDFVLNSQASNLNVRGVSGDFGRGFDVEAVNFKQGEQNTLNLSGKLLRDHSTFGGKFALKNLAGLDSILAGALAGELKLEGDFMHPSVQLTANSEDLGAAGIVLKNLDVNAGVSLAEAAQGADLRVTTDSVKFSESMQPVGKCSIVASGWLPGHSLDLNCEGENGAVIALKGSFDEAFTRWEGELDALSLSSEFSGALALEEPVHAQVNLNELQGSVGLIKLSGDPGSLSIGVAGSKDGQQPGGSEFSLKDVRSGLDFSLPELASIPVLTDLLKGALEGRLRVSGPLLQPEVTLDVNSPELGAAGTSLSGLKLKASVVTRKPDAGTAAAPAAAVAAVTTAAHPVTDFVLYPAALVEEEPQAFDLGSQHVKLSIVSDSVKFSDTLKSAGKCSVNLSGWISSHALEVDCDGANGGKVKLAGGLDEKFTVWEGALFSLSVRSQYSSPLDLQQQVHAKIQLDELKGEVAPLKLAGAPGVISLGESKFSQQSLHSSLNISALKLEDFAGLFLPPELGLTGGEVTLDAGTVDVTFKPNEVPDVHAGLKLNIGGGTFKASQLKLPYHGLHMDANLQPKEWSASLSFALADENGNPGPAFKMEKLKLEEPLGEGKLSGTFSLDELELERFRAAGGIFSTLTGTAGIQGGRLDGSLKLPLLFQEKPDTVGALRDVLIYGTVAASGSAEPGAGMGLGRVEKFDFKVTASGHSGSVDSCLIKFGEGQQLNLDKGTLNLEIDERSSKLSSELHGEVTLPQLESVHKSLAGKLNGTLNGKSEITFIKDAAPDIDADFTLNVDSGSFAYQFTDPAASGAGAEGSAGAGTAAAGAAPAGMAAPGSAAPGSPAESTAAVIPAPDRTAPREQSIFELAKPAGSPAAGALTADTAVAVAADADTVVLDAAETAVAATSSAGPAASGTSAPAVAGTDRSASGSDSPAAADAPEPLRKLELSYDYLNVTAGMHNNVLTVNGDFALAEPEQNGSLQSEVTIKDPLGKGELAGTLNLNPLNLGLFTTALTGVFNSLEGTASISDGEFHGTLQVPVFLGTIAVKGSAEPVFDPGRLHKFDLNLTTSGSIDDLNLEGNMNLLGLEAGGRAAGAGSAGEKSSGTSNGLLNLLLNIKDLTAQGAGAGKLDGTISLKDLNLGLFSAAGGVFEELEGTAALTGPGKLADGSSAGKLYGTLGAPLFDGVLAVNGSAKFKQELGVGEVEKLNLKVSSQGSHAEFVDSVIRFAAKKQEKKEEQQKQNKENRENQLTLAGSVDWGSGQDGAMQFTSKGLKLNVSLRGLKEVYTLLAGDLDGTISLKDGNLLQPVVSVNLNSGEFQAAGAVTVKNLTLTGGADLAEARPHATVDVRAGSVKFAEGLRPAVNCSISASGWLASHRLDLNCEGDNRARIKVQGGLRDENKVWEGDLSEFSAATEFTGSPLKLQDKVHATIRLNEPGGTIDPIRIAGDQAGISIGRFVREGDEVTVKPTEFSLKKDVYSGVEFSVPDLAAFPVVKDKLAGNLEGSLDVSGPASRITAVLEVNSADLQAAGTGIKNFAVVGNLDGANLAGASLQDMLGALSVNLNVSADNIRATESLEPVSKCTLSLSGKPAGHMLGLNCGQRSKNGGNLQLTGRIADDFSTWDGELAKLDFHNQFSSPVKLRDDAKVNIHLDLNELSGTVGMLVLDSALGSLKLGRNKEKNGFEGTKFSSESVTTGLEVTGMKLSKLAPYLPQGIKLLGGGVKTLKADDIEVKFGGAGSGGKQTGSATAVSGNLDLEIEPGTFEHKDMNLDLRYDSLVVKAGISNEALTVTEVDLKLPGRTPGSPVSELALTEFTLSSPLDGQPFSDKAISGKLALRDLDLENFSTVGGQFDELKGLIAGDFKLGGTLKSPRVWGVTAVKGLAEPRYKIGQAREFDLQLTANGNRGRLNGQIMLNGGLFDFGGDLAWGEHIPGGFELRSFELKSKGMPVSALGYGSCLVDIDLKTKLGKTFEVKGTVAVPSCNIDVSGLGSGGSSPSADAVVIGDEGRSAVMQKTADAGGAPPLDGSIDLTVELGQEKEKNISFSAPEGLKGRIVGKLAIKKEAGSGSLDDISGDGTISVVDCKSGEFWVNRADLIFNGPVSEPTIYLEVIRSPFSVENQAEAGVRVTGKLLGGSAATLEPQFFANPSMRQEEIISYMRPLLTSMDTIAMALGGVMGGAAGQLSSLMNKLPVEVSYSEGQANVRKRIFDKTVLSLGQELSTGQQQIKVMRELWWPRFYGEVVSSLSFAVDVIYSFETGEFFKKQSE